MIRTYAKKTPDPSDVELQNARLARKIAAESIVLLENDGTLPLKGKKIALFGEGAVFTVKGGTGSGEVNCRHTVSIWEGLKNAGFSITTEPWLKAYSEFVKKAKADYTAMMRKRAGFMNFAQIGYIVSHPFNAPNGAPLSEKDMLQDAEACIYVLSRQAGENVDRRPVEGDFLLTKTEIENIRKCVERYPHVILVINIGGIVDLTPIEDLALSSILFFAQQGQEGGNSLADILTGKTTPSGKLAQTWIRQYSDVPFADEFSHLNGNLKEEFYKEDIYVGYRYFDSFCIEPRYPFGYGASYTTFSITADVSVEGAQVFVRAKVTNTGKYNGKETIQVYVSCPQTQLKKEFQRLTGFAKTRTLSPGISQDIEITFELSCLASYDESSHSTLVEQGKYIVRVGNSSRDTVPAAVLIVNQTAVLSIHDRICPQKEPFERLQPNRTEASVQGVPEIVLDLSSIQAKSFSYLPAPLRDPEAEKMILDLSAHDLTYLCVGSGVDIALPKKYYFNVPGAGGYTTPKFEKKGLPALPMADAPAGLRLFARTVIRRNQMRMADPVMAFMDYLPTLCRMVMFGNTKKGRLAYQYATAFPVGMALGQTWNAPLLEKMGAAVQAEMQTFGVNVWLSPAINLYRNPLCGRNYEYYSEDPLLTGKLAASLIRGVQSKLGFAATIKHFCCNNQEVNRRYVSENVSERAIRELYIRSFEIALKESAPKCLMTSYNKVNGVYTAESYDLCTKVLRCEWGYDGVLMTDWSLEKDTINAAKVIKAGGCLLMPGKKLHRKQLQRALKCGTLSETELRKAAVYIARLIKESDLYKTFLKNTQSFRQK